MSRNSKRMLLIAGSATFLALSVSSAMAINATTVNPIRGHEPLFQDNNAGNKLGFEVKPGEYFNKSTNPNDGFVFDGPLSNLKDIIKVEPFADGDFTITDLDGDADNPDDVSLSVEDLGIKLVDATGKEIPLDSLAATETVCDIDSKNLYPSPYTVVVNANYIPSTKFGNPQTGEAIPISQSYEYDLSGSCAGQIGKIKFVKPIDSGAARNVTAGEGFTFDKGFTYDAGFPTIGFEGARFTFGLDGDTDPALYELESSDVAVATVDDKNIVTLKGKGTATINVKPKGSDIIKDSYTFTIGTWLQVPHLNNNVCSMSGTGTNSCTNNCASIRGMIPYIEVLTNASVKIGGGNEFLVRQMDGSLFGQWGNISKYNDERNKPGYLNGSYISLNMPDSGAGYYAATSTDGRVSVQTANALGLGLLCMVN